MFPSILIKLENGPNDFCFYFYFVLRPSLVAKKIGKTKNKKRWPNIFRLHRKSHLISGMGVYRGIHYSSLFISFIFAKNVDYGYSLNELYPQSILSAKIS